MNRIRCRRIIRLGMEKLCGHIADLSEGQKIEGIGACFPGIIDKDNMVTTANNLPDWTMKPIRQYLQDRFGVPVKLLHDAQGAALGEAIFGAARQYGPLCIFHLGHRHRRRGHQKDR